MQNFQNTKVSNLQQKNITIIKQQTSFNQNLNLNLNYQLSQKVITYIINTKIIQPTFSKIQQIQLLKHIPQYLYYITQKQLRENITALQPNYSKSKTNKIIQEKISDVYKIGIDNLVPKNIVRQEKQKNIDDYLMSQLELGRSIRTLSPKLKINKKRSSFMKGLSSNLGSISSIQQSHQNNHNNNNKMNQSNIASSIASKFKSKMNNNQKKPSPFISLPPQPQQQQFMKRQRLKKDKIVQQQQKILFIQKKRKKQLQEKIQNFNVSYQSKDYTFSFDGDVFNVQNLNQKNNGRIRYNGLTSRIGGLTKKIRDDFKQMDQASKSLNLKKGYLKGNNNNSQGIQGIQQIPMPNQSIFKIANLGPPQQLQKYKLKDYKKYYGGKFHRLDRSLMNTIDIVNNQQDPHQALFNSRREIKDNTNNNLKTLENSRKHHQIARKIALPKLRGNYKCLDRYQEI